MKKIEQLERKDSAWNKASMSEPVFVLRAKDPLAATAVRTWALMAQDVASSYHEPDKVVSAFAVATAMEDWRESHVKPETSEEVVSVGIQMQTPDGRIITVESVGDLPGDVPQEVRDITQRLLDAKQAALQEGGNLDLRSIAGSLHDKDEDDLCDLCKAAGSKVCLGDILPDRSMDILAAGLGFSDSSKATKH